MKAPRDTARINPPAQTPRLVLGLQPVREAIRVHGERLGKVMVERGGGDKSRLDALARFAGDHGVADVRRVARRDLDQVAGGVYHQGVAAWAPELMLRSPDAVLSAPNLLCVALDGIQDPQNFGAVVRSAVGFGATAVVWPEHASAPLTPATFERRLVPSSMRPCAACPRSPDSSTTRSLRRPPSSGSVPKETRPSTPSTCADQSSS